MKTFTITLETDDNVTLTTVEEAISRAANSIEAQKTFFSVSEEEEEKTPSYVAVKITDIKWECKDSEVENLELPHTVDVFADEACSISDKPWTEKEAATYLKDTYGYSIESCAIENIGSIKVVAIEWDWTENDLQMRLESMGSEQIADMLYNSTGHSFDVDGMEKEDLFCEFYTLLETGILTPQQVFVLPDMIEIRKTDKEWTPEDIANYIIGTYGFYILGFATVEN